MYCNMNEEISIKFEKLFLKKLAPGEQWVCEMKFNGLLGTTYIGVHVVHTSRVTPGEQHM